MLVVHPASTCDICLDPYSITAEPVKSPHAIPCGHTFCLTCLRNLSPSACPLCRKTFRQDGNVKKLHVAEPPELDGVSEGAENAQLLSLLQRVALVSVEDAPDDEVVQVLAEVDEWLSQHSEDPSSNQPLRSAVAALRQHKALQDQTARDKAEHRRLRHELKHSMKSADHDLQTSRAEKESLLTQIEELKAVYSREISGLQAKLDSLKKAQNTHISYHNASNPLPPPPEPLPADRFPPFLRPGATNIDPLLDPTSYPSHIQKSKQRTNLPNGSSSTPAPYVGSSHTHVEIPQISQPIAIRPKQGDAIQEDGRNRRLPSREDSYQHHRRYSSSSTHNRGVDSSTPDSRHKVNEIPRGGIIRGPSPSVRVVVPSPYWSHQPLAEERWPSEERETHRRDRSDGSMGRRPTSRNAPVQDAGTRAAAAYMHGYGAGYDSGYRIVNQPRSTSSSYGSNYSRGGRGFPVAESPDVGGLGLVGVPPRAPSGSVIIPEDYDATPVNRTSRLNRRHTTHVVGVEQPPYGSGGNSLPDRPPNGFSQPVHGQTATRTLEVPGRSTAHNGTDRVDAVLTRRQARVAPPITMPLAGDDVSPRSDTTWGTTSTDTLGLGEALVGLHNGGARGQRSVSDSAAVGRNGVDGYIANGGLDNETDGGSGTPTLPGVFAPTPIGTSALGLITEEDPSEGVRARRYNPSRTSATTQQTQVGHDHQSYHARRDERTRDHHRHVSQPTRTEVLSHAQEPGNALYLHFDASPLPHDNTHTIPSVHSGVHGRSLDIVAPTPIFGGPSVAHLWANRV